MAKCLLAVHQVSEEAARSILHHWGVPRDLELVHQSSAEPVCFWPTPDKVEYLFSYEAPVAWALEDAPTIMDLTVVPVEV